MAILAFLTTQTAKTEYVEFDGIKIAYRRLGKSSGIPLVMLIHFRGNMDLWDPLLLDSLAEHRPVIILDNAGIGRSTGEISPTFQGWANIVISFLNALAIEKIDLLGFSMSGAAAQMVALTAPDLVRRLILAGTTASQSDEFQAVDPETFFKYAGAVTDHEFEQAHTEGMFPATEEGRAQAKLSWTRIQQRKDRAENVSVESGKQQIAAWLDWVAPNPRNSYDRLSELKMPVFVANGDEDVIIATYNSWVLMKHIPNAHLHIYPNANHGFLYQHAKIFTSHVNQFLEE
jgi:pimeloyl-ACP methyl ester carboxylesterase